MTASLASEPLTPVGRAWAWRFNFAWVGVMVGFFGPIQVLLPNQAQALAPDHKEYVLGLVTALGAACSLVANPLWGSLSDRTSSRWGRRVPWIVAGALGGVLGLLVLGSARSVLMMVVGWCLVQTTLNASWAALTAVVPDQVPRSQRGSVAGWLGLAQIVGVFVAVGIATVLPGREGYLACAVVMVAVMAPFVLRSHDPPGAASVAEPWTVRGFLAGLWVDPRRHPDFGWAWLTRFLINLANATTLVYLLYFLRDGLGRQRAEADLLLLVVVNALGVVAAVVVSGVWSDRLGRRRIFVIASGVVMAVAALVLAAVPSWPVLVGVALVIGVGFGIYTSVDFALITEVLPDADARGKDMGVLNIASALPQVLAPAVAAPLVTTLGYPALFVVSCLAALLGGVLVHRIRSVP